jgi:hypothetical protein
MATQLAESETSAPTPAGSASSDQPAPLMGAAIFALNGLPQRFFQLETMTNKLWIQAALQALGISSLLTQRLAVGHLTTGILHSDQHTIVLLQRQNHWIALLMRRDESCQSYDFDHFAIADLENHPHLREW